ncbi:hypothetical protein [Altererythrobacter aquiaggeris]|uniref:hypothetical protein n=1 Tax=Aestuarierythrobacter aquiaggeris TaxID=1898396 RepID=UPI003019A6DD
MKSLLKSAAVGCACAVLAATPASAREIDRIEIVQMVDPATRVTSSSACRTEKSVAAGQIEKLKLCTDWRHELSYTVVRRFLVASSDDKLDKEQRKLVGACLNRAAARGQTEARGADVMLSDTRGGFDRCAVSSGITNANAISLAFEDKHEKLRLR